MPEAGGVRQGTLEELAEVPPADDQAAADVRGDGRIQTELTRRTRATAGQNFVYFVLFVVNPLPAADSVLPVERLD
jgi:hypothetical protein